MRPGVATKVVAASCGLSGFAIGVVAGLAADNPAEVILGRSIIAMLICHLVGWIVGGILERIFRDGVKSYENERLEREAGDQSTDDQQVLSV